MSLAFSQSLRLNDEDSFKRVFNRAEVCRSKGWTLLSCSNTLGHARLGVIISKNKVSKKAWQRNRLKRVARENFRINQHHLSPKDMIVIASPKSVHLDNAQLGAELRTLFLQRNQA